LFSEKIQEITYHIYDGLPPNVRAFVSPVVPAFLFLKRVVFFASQFRLSVYLLQGKEKWSGKSLRTLLLGEGAGLLYVSSLLYSEEPAKESLGRVFIWGIKSKLNLNLPRADLILVNTNGFFLQFLIRLGFTIVPEWVLFLLDLSKPIHEIWKLSKNKNLSETLRRIRKYNYSSEMTQDPAKFEYFYHQMYLPYVTSRFKELSVLTGFRDMERIFRKGHLLLVKRGNDYVSGNVIKRDGDTVFAPYSGITEGKMEYLKTGALTALYYFTIVSAKEMGCKWLDFGHCRSFLKDGVFNYKKQWGMMIRMSTRLSTILGMRVCNFSQAVRNFLEKNPFIFVDQEKLKGMILIEQNHPLTLEEAQSLVKAYSITGLDCLVVLSVQGFTQETEEFGCSNQRLHLMSEKPDSFFLAFPHVPARERFNG
jgi:hypothetical protein